MIVKVNCKINWKQSILCKMPWYLLNLIHFGPKSLVFEGYSKFVQFELYSTAIWPVVDQNFQWYSSRETGLFQTPRWIKVYTDHRNRILYSYLPLFRLSKLWDFEMECNPTLWQARNWKFGFMWYDICYIIYFVRYCIMNFSLNELPTWEFFHVTISIQRLSRLPFYWRRTRIYFFCVNWEFEFLMSWEQWKFL